MNTKQINKYIILEHRGAQYGSRSCSADFPLKQGQVFL